MHARAPHEAGTVTPLSLGLVPSSRYEPVGAALDEAAPPIPPLPLLVAPPSPLPLLREQPAHATAITSATTACLVILMIASLP